MPIKAFGMSDIGSARSSNEDSFGTSDALCLYTVADGMGGHAAGEVASKMAVETILEYMSSTEGEPDITLPFSIPGNLPLVAKRLGLNGKPDHAHQQQHCANHCLILLGWVPS